MTKHHFGRIADAMTILAVVMPVASYGSSDERDIATTDDKPVLLLAASGSLASPPCGQEQIDNIDNKPVATEAAHVQTQMELRHFAAYLNTQALFSNAPNEVAFGNGAGPANAASDDRNTMNNKGAASVESCVIEPEPQHLIRTRGEIGHQ